MERLIMHSQIRQLKIVAKLPSYLFLLTAISDINEKIYLHCQKNERELISSMLSLIGIQACYPDTELSSDIRSFYVLNSIFELQQITSVENNSHNSIFYITKETPDKTAQEKIASFIIKYPHYIIVTDIEPSISKKSFFIHIHQDNRYYRRLENHVLHNRNMYQIQKISVY